MSTLPQINRVLSSILGIPESEVSDETNLGNSEQERWIRHRQLCAALRESYDLRFEEPEISLDVTAAGLRQFLRRKGVLDV